jgi:hypothetical protein
LWPLLFYQFIAVFVLALYSIDQMKNVSFETSTAIVQNKLRGDSHNSDMARSVL